LLWLDGVVVADAGAAADAVEEGAAAEAADVGGHSCVRWEQRLLQRRPVAPAGPEKIYRKLAPILNFPSLLETLFRQ